MLFIGRFSKVMVMKNKQQDARIEELDPTRKKGQSNDFMEREDSTFYLKSKYLICYN